MKYKGREIEKVYDDGAIGSCKNCIFNKESPCENINAVGINIDCAYSVYTIKLDFEKIANDLVAPIAKLNDAMEQATNALNDFSLAYLGVSGERFNFEEAIEREEILVNIYNTIE